MPQIYINYGRQMANCPLCNSPHAVADDQATFVCVVCFPDAMAFAFVQRGRVFRRVPDEELRAAAAAQAAALGQVWTLERPAEMDAITRLLNRRRQPQRNWTVESLDDLRAENAALGLSVED